MHMLMYRRQRVHVHSFLVCVSAFESACRYENNVVNLEEEIASIPSLEKFSKVSARAL